MFIETVCAERVLNAEEEILHMTRVVTYLNTSENDKRRNATASNTCLMATNPPVEFYLIAFFGFHSDYRN